MPKKQRRKRAQQPTPPQPTPDDHMSVEEAAAFLDRWAAEQNEIAEHNLRVLQQELIAYAERNDLAWRTTGLEAVRQARDAARRQGGRKGAPVSDAQLAREYARAKADNPHLKAQAIYERVGDRHNLAGSTVYGRLHKRQGRRRKT